MIVKVLFAVALPMFVLAIAFAVKRKRFSPLMQLMRAPGKFTSDAGVYYEATAPRLAGALLVLSLLLAGTAGVLALLGG